MSTPHNNFHFSSTGGNFINPVQRVDNGGGVMGELNMASNNANQPHASPPAGSPDPSIHNNPVQHEQSEYQPRQMDWFIKGKIFRTARTVEGVSNELQLVIINDSSENCLALQLTQSEDHDESRGHFQCKHLLLHEFAEWKTRCAIREASETGVLFVQYRRRPVQIPANTRVELIHEHIIQAGTNSKEVGFLDGDSLKALRKAYLLTKAESWGFTQEDFKADW